MLSITNVTGQELSRIRLPHKAGQNKWSVRELPAGVYIFKVLDGKQVISAGKVVVSK